MTIFITMAVLVATSIGLTATVENAKIIHAVREAKGEIAEDIETAATVGVDLVAGADVEVEADVRASGNVSGEGESNAIPMNEAGADASTELDSFIRAEPSSGTDAHIDSESTFEIDL